MYERMLVPLDGSSAAEMVIPYAEEIAAKIGAEIILVSVSESKAADMSHLNRAYLEHITKEIQRRLKDWGAKKESKVHSHLLMGKPADEILRYSDESNVDLIVMASRGSSGQGRWRLGNIATKVLQATSRPVLLVKAAASATAIEKKRLVKRILMPLDGSTVGEAAIPCAEALARALGAELVLFRVAQLVAVPGMVGEPVYDLGRNEESARASAIAYLDGVGKPLQARGLSISRAAVVGSPASLIIGHAEANAIDLIAMSTHGRSGIGRWVFGSVTDKILHAGDTPVLVVRAAKT